MVRFIINIPTLPFECESTFTFHYGQIYYNSKPANKNNKKSIYIPLWLDLLSPNKIVFPFANRYLHSTMVRFIII